MAEKLKPGKIGGELSGTGLRFGIVVSRFNDFITERLLSASLDALERAGALRAISRALDAGKLVSNVGMTLPLSDTVAAHQAVESGKVTGNVVVRLP